MGHDFRVPPNYITITSPRIFAFLFLSFFALEGACRADDLFPLSTDDEMERVETQGEASRLIRDADEVGLAPNRSILAAVTNVFREIDADIGVEVVFVSGLDERFEILDSANTLLEVSKLKGLQYFSVSRGVMRLLFEESYFIESADNHIRRSDPSIESMPTSLSLYVLQRDLTFGENIYRFHFAATRSLIHLWFENLTPFKYGPIRFIRSNDMRLHIFLLPESNRLIYYGFFAANAIRFPLVERTMHTSFYNRIAALYTWFTEQT